MISVTDILQQSVVVFSRNYLPINRINIKRAIALLVTGKAEPLENFSETLWEINSPSMLLVVPSHIRLLLSGGERIWQVPTVNRRALLRRDRHQCQYCGVRQELTIDRVIPRSRGGKHSWDNVVIACATCNSRKGNRTPKEAGMLLKNKPKNPIHPTIAFAEKFWSEKQL